MGKAEAEVEDYLVKRVEAIGGFVRKLQWVGRNGAPDRFIAYKGVMCFVEVKSIDGSLEESQKREIPRMEEHGIPVLIINSKEQVNQIIFMLQKHENFHAVKQRTERSD